MMRLVRIGRWRVRANNNFLGADETRATRVISGLGTGQLAAGKWQIMANGALRNAHYCDRGPTHSESDP